MHRFFRWTSLVAVALLLITTGLTAGVVRSQEATPTVDTCEAPELPPGTPTPFEEMDEMEMGEPEMDEEELGEATPVAEGMAADETTAERVIAAIENVVVCYNTGDFLALAALFTPEALLEEFGVSNPYDMPLAMEGGPPLTIEAISDDVQIHDDGRLSAGLVIQFGVQLSRERWYLVESDDLLLIDEFVELPTDAPEGAITIEAQMLDFEFELSQDTAPADTPLVFQVTNVGEYPHELVILRVEEGLTVEQVFEEGMFEAIEFLGGTYSEAGEPAPDLVVTGLEAGTYTLVCFIDEPEGIPHAFRGMIAELTVE